MGQRLDHLIADGRQALCARQGQRGLHGRGNVRDDGGDGDNGRLVGLVRLLDHTTAIQTMCRLICNDLSMTLDDVEVSHALRLKESGGLQRQQRDTDHV